MILSRVMFCYMNVGVIIGFCSVCLQSLNPEMLGLAMCYYRLPLGSSDHEIDIWTRQMQGIVRYNRYILFYLDMSVWIHFRYPVRPKGILFFAAGVKNET